MQSVVDRVVVHDEDGDWWLVYGLINSAQRLERPDRFFLIKVQDEEQAGELYAELMSELGVKHDRVCVNVVTDISAHWNLTVRS